MLIGRRGASLAVCMCLCSGAAATVFPTGPHAANNLIPLGNNQVGVMHEVFAGSLFSQATGGAPAQITAIALAPGVNGDYSANITIRLGYTNAVPGVSSGGGGLQVPDSGGGGVPNASGPMTDFYSNANFFQTFAGAGTENFQMVFNGTPFVYDPSHGNLLVEIVANVPPSPNVDLAVSRTAGSAEASRSYNTTRFSGESPTTALRMDFTFTAVQGSTCYANCDGSTATPFLNVNDFICFQGRFAAGDTYANCDGSTQAPVLNVNDFICFQSQFAAGCSAP